MSQYLTVPPHSSFAMPPHAYPLGPITAHSPGRGQGWGQRQDVVPVGELFAFVLIISSLFLVLHSRIKFPSQCQYSLETVLVNYRPQ